ncbi:MULTISPECIES: TIGR03619 family F420-dependent LLM class oxidoreductase [Streptomyces]|nr:MULTISPECIES: TIGR03619 family F420-dependent LLM class oxidoreductase [Streptomyces]MZD16956.1 TIGR03619 family F420-dependent LLM class oxidoreductase [Streptomyces sp. SID5476]
MSRAVLNRHPELGIALPTNRVHLTSARLGRIVKALEEAGCTSLWVNDHLAAFPVGSENYPYSATGDITWDPELPQYEALTTCGFLANTSDRMKVGTSVLVLPQRHPVAVAQAAATLADLTEGRFRLGVGAGWSRREMTLLGWDPATRGARMDEELDIIRTGWGQRRRLARWVHYDIPPDVIFRPRPTPATVPPVLVGGTSAAAHQRVLKFGDGWLAVARGDDPASLAQAGAVLTRLRDRSERPLTGVLKVALPHPDERWAVRALEETVGHDWDEVTFEFDEWRLDETCSLVSACNALGRTVHDAPSHVG